MLKHILHSLPQAIARLAGWQRNALAFALGVLATLTLAPFYLFPLLIPSFSGLIWLLDGAKTRRRMFWDGWWWGWGFYTTGLYWFCIALLTEPEKFAWLIPFALFGLTGVIALYPALACWLTGWIRARGVIKIAAFTAVWAGIEYARGHLFTGFPWNLAGYSFGFSDAALQMASLCGVYGLTWLAVALGAAAAAWRHGRPGKIFAVALWGMFAAGMAWGEARLRAADAVPEAQRQDRQVKLRLVQANIAQPHKWNPESQLQGLKEHIALTLSPGIEDVTHIVWPETAVPYVVAAGAPVTRLLREAIPPGKFLITGALRSEGEKEEWRLWNSLMILDHRGDIAGHYDKLRLVPFGEFLPLRRLFPKSWLTPVGDKDFDRGVRGGAMQWPRLPPVIPLICYEAIFPDLSASDGGRARLLLNVTNDAWFGVSSGPYQHFDMARLRAVEQGIPLIRVANTGITAAVDGFGRVLSSIALGNKGVIDVYLPAAADAGTIYGR